MNEELVRVGQCTICGKPSIWNETFQRWMHTDGSNNGKCWRREAVR